MPFQSLHHSSSRLVRFSVSGLFVIQSTIATTAIGAIVSTQPGWIGSQQAAAQARPGTISTSARDLSGLKEANCQPSSPSGIPEEKPSFCGGVGGDKEQWDSVVRPSLDNPNPSTQPINFDSFDFMRTAPSSGCQPSQNRVVLFCSPLF